MEIIEGLRRPDGGTVSVFGLSPWPRNPRLLPRIGVQLQASSFFERLTAREQIYTFASLYGVPHRRADAWLDVVGLAGQADQRTEKLSGGQQQRLSLACALAHDPEIVFLDEPSAGLDPQARRNLWDVLREINRQGRTVMLTTHYMDEAEALCDRVAILDHGRILDVDPPATLVRRVDVPTRIGVVSGALSVGEATALADGADVADDGVTLTISTRDPAPVLAALAKRDALRGLRVEAATLDGLQLSGAWWMALPLVLVGTLAFLAIGLLAGAVSKTPEAATAVANLIVLPMAFLSGAFFPLESSPGWLRAVSDILPLKHLVEAMQGVMVRGESPASALPAIAILLGFTVVVSALAIRMFRWDDV